MISDGDLSCFSHEKLDCETAPYLDTDYGPPRLPRYEGRAYEAPAGSWRARWVDEKKRYWEARKNGELDGFASSDDLAALQGTRVSPFALLAQLPELAVLGERAIGAARILAVLVSLHDAGHRGACVKRGQLADACALKETTGNRRLRGLIALGLVEQVCLLFWRHGAASSCCGAAYRVPAHVLGRIARDSVTKDLASGTDSGGVPFQGNAPSENTQAISSVRAVHNSEPASPVVVSAAPTVDFSVAVPDGRAGDPLPVRRQVESCSVSRRAPDGEVSASGAGDRVTSTLEIASSLRQSDDPTLRELAEYLEHERRRRAAYGRGGAS